MDGNTKPHTTPSTNRNISLEFRAAMAGEKLYACQDECSGKFYFLARRGTKFKQFTTIEAAEDWLDEAVGVQHG